MFNEYFYAYDVKILSITFSTHSKYIFHHTKCLFSAKSSIYTVAAEQKARTTYENLMRLAKDPEVYKVLKFLREREIVHFQRFGEALEFVRVDLNKKNYYAYNPAFDK